MLLVLHLLMFVGVSVDALAFVCFMLQLLHVTVISQPFMHA
jgi:hypothetical protein